MSSDIGITNNLTHQRAKSLETLRLAQTKKTDQKNNTATTQPLTQDKISLSAPDLFENISKIQGFLDDISYGKQIVQTSLESLGSIVEKFEEIGGLAIRAESTISSSLPEELKAPQIAEFEKKASNLSQEISRIVQNNGFKEKNLLEGDTIILAGDSSGFPLNAEGVIISTRDFGLDNIQFRSKEESLFIKNLILNAIDQASLFKSQLNGFSFELDTREDFSEASIQTFVTQAQLQTDQPSQSEAEALEDLQYRLKKSVIESEEPLGATAQVELLQQFR